MRTLIMTWILTASSAGWASSFVGNGGNAGDVELEVALRQLSETLSAVAKTGPNSEMKLCTCYNRFDGRPTCRVLKQLNEKQVEYCASYIKSKASEMSNMLSQRSQIHFNWTNESITVTEQTGPRGADAVTDASSKKITIDQDKFLSMNAPERAFLIAHEVYHLTQMDGKFLSDEGSQGPFEGTDGGRQFINAMANSLVMESYRIGSFDKYNRSLNRSQAIKPFWLQLGFQSLMISGNSENPYLIDNTLGLQLGFRYQFSDWGVLADYSQSSAEKDILSTAKGKEERQVLGVGIAYRWFPYTDPTTFAGQSHFLFTLKWEQLQAKYTLKDSFVSMDDKAYSSGVSVGANYYIPLKKNFWVQGGLAFSNHQYEFEQLKVFDSTAQYKNSNVTFSLGASYAF